MVARLSHPQASARSLSISIPHAFMVMAMHVLMTASAVSGRRQVSPLRLSVRSDASRNALVSAVSRLRYL